MITNLNPTAWNGGAPVPQGRSQQLPELLDTHTYPSDSYTVSDPVGDWQPPGRQDMLAFAEPRQHTEKTRHYNSPQEAGANFRRESSFLLHPDQWNSGNCGVADPVWTRMDKHGMEDKSSRALQTGDVLRIANPGESNYYVKVENTNQSPGHVDFTVRPTTDPNVAPGSETTHFFTKDATRTFSLDQQGNDVTFTTHAENEYLNVGSDAGDFSVGNAVSGAMIRAGGGDLYWGQFADKVLDQ